MVKFALILLFVSMGLIVIDAGWLTVLGVFMFGWSINVDNSLKRAKMLEEIFKDKE